MERHLVIERHPVRTKLINCPKCGMDSGVRILISKGSKEWAIVRCQSCKAQTKRYEYFPSATKAWNMGKLEEKYEDEKSAQA